MGGNLSNRSKNELNLALAAESNMFESQALVLWIQD